MSNFNWEEGTIKIPAREWVRARRALIEAYNKHQDERLALAREAYHAAKKEAAGRRGFNQARWVESQERYYEISWYLCKPNLKRVFAPKRSQFPRVLLTKGVFLRYDECCITLNNLARTVFYSSGENNRQVERAREHPITRKLFQILGGIKWTRGSGGVLTGNDEYNRECKGDGGGGCYVTARYGPGHCKGYHAF
jgi:hypothetical protein